jgi:hypothetical protein
VGLGAATPRKFLTASYAGDVAMRDAVDARRIIESPNYQLAFGDVFQLTTDQNVKTRYENDRRGRRTVTSTDAPAPGFGGDIRIVDDPVSAKKATARGDREVDRVVARHDGHARERPGDRRGDRGAPAPEQQRPDRLPAGRGEGLGAPGAADALRPGAAQDDQPGLQDPRRPRRAAAPRPPARGDVKELEKSIGVYHTNAQLQQNPAPRSGIIFKRADWKYWKALPELDETVISVDCTFKDLESSDYVAIQAWGARARTTTCAGG